MGKGNLIRWDEAAQVIDAIANPITKRMVLRGVTIARNRFRDASSSPDVDLDVKLLAELLVELFGDLDVLRAELAGDRPGAWFEDEVAAR
jgi:hypothetical protein